jgi:phosphonate transport system substrate-binding protein
MRKSGQIEKDVKVSDTAVGNERRANMRSSVMVPHMRAWLSMLLALGVCAGMAPISKASDTLSLGIFPRRNVEDNIRMHTPMAEYLSEKLGIKVQLKTSRDFETFWKHVADRRFDIVHYNPYHYVKSAKEYGYRVILKNEENGADSIAGAIFARKDSGIRDIRGLKGKRIVFGGGPSAMFSYLVPTYLLQQSGLKEGDYIRSYAISPPHALFSAFYGHVDAAGAGSTVIDFDTVKKKIDVTGLAPIAMSGQFTHLPWAVRDNLDRVLAAKVQALLSRLAQSARGKEVLRSAGLTGLNVSHDEEYDEHRKIIWHVLGENYCVRNCGYLRAPPVACKTVNCNVKDNPDR